ncbi:hypothetical protein ABZX62_25360 [Streptomyces flavidovirens]|uniref:Uncharacterized protein n=1 Tax=Streptomyces flavidovirens TaxID=67298 RepID=A0ABW6RAA6_9ACTN
MSDRRFSPSRRHSALRCALRAGWNLAAVRGISAQCRISNKARVSGRDLGYAQ